MNESHGALRRENGKNDRGFNITSLTVSRMRTFWFLVDEYCGNARQMLVIDSRHKSLGLGQYRQQRWQAN